MELFNKIVKEHFEPNGFIVSKLSETKQWNVLRVYNPSDKQYYIAKGILHIEDDDEKNPKQMDKSFNNEINVLSILPEWWGIYLKDSFKDGPFRVVVTPEISNCNWTNYKGNDKDIAYKIYKQVEWLHGNKIAHNDLEIKNILLTCDNKNAIVIDFEKTTYNATDTSMRDDYRKVIESLNEKEETRGIAKHLKKITVGKLPLTRRFSFGGKSKHKRYKTHKKSIRDNF